MKVINDVIAVRLDQKTDGGIVLPDAERSVGIVEDVCKKYWCEASGDWIDNPIKKGDKILFQDTGHEHDGLLFIRVKQVLAVL